MAEATKVNKYGFSSSQMATDEEVIHSILPKMIIHDWRGFSPEQRLDEGWLEGIYISNNYLWVLEYNKVLDAWKGEFTEEIILRKYDRPFRLVGDRVVFEKIAEWEIDPSDEIGMLIKSYLPKPPGLAFFEEYSRYNRFKEIFEKIRKIFTKLFTLR